MHKHSDNSGKFYFPAEPTNVTNTTLFAADNSTKNIGIISYKKRYTCYKY